MRTWTLLLLWPVALGAKEPSPSAFRFKTDTSVKHLIKLDEIMQGVRGKGDPRDKIPAIRKPQHAAANKAPWVVDKTRVLGLVVNGEARAYPIYILQLHEMVNDRLGGVPVGPNY